VYDIKCNVVDPKELQTMAAHPQEQYVVDPKAKKTAVILSLKRYQELMADLHDLAWWRNGGRSDRSACKR
jgi:PHD/YefM family antitoxin component YafN of YafNO toxin-antitoxin module